MVTNKLSRSEINGKILLKSCNKFVLKALCDELFRYEIKYNPLVLMENETYVKIDLENKSIEPEEGADFHFELPKDYLSLIKKIDTVYKRK